MTNTKRTPVLPKILAVFAMTKEVNKWQIKKRTDLSYSNVHGVINDLLNEKLIEVTQTKKSKKNRYINVNYYRLTMNGLIFTLKLLGEGEIWNHIDDIVVAQEDKLPLIFGKWTFWQENNQEKTIIRHLCGVTFEPIYSLNSLPILSKEDAPKIEEIFNSFNKQLLESYKTSLESIQEAISERQREEFLRKLVDLKSLKEKAKWEIYKWVFIDSWKLPVVFFEFLKVMAKDSDLHVFVDLYFDSKQKEIDNAQENLNSWKIAWQKSNSLKSPGP